MWKYMYKYIQEYVKTSAKLISPYNNRDCSNLLTPSNEDKSLESFSVKASMLLMAHSYLDIVTLRSFSSPGANCW